MRPVFFDLMLPLLSHKTHIAAALSIPGPVLWGAVVVLALLGFVMAIRCEGFVRDLGRLLGHCLYRVKVHGLENLPSGGCLLLPNHVTWVDAIILQLACPRPIRFVIFEEIYHQPLLHPIFRAVKAIPIAPSKAKEGIRAAAAHIAAGEIVCVFPEGELSRTGTLLKLKKGFEIIAREAEALVVPVWLDELWGSVFSFERGRFFTKWPRKIPYPVSVAFGAPVPAAEASVERIRERLLDLGEFCYQQRPFLRGHLARACVRGLRRNQFHTAIIDGMDDSTLSRGMVLAVGITLAGWLRKEVPDRRVAVVLPPGKGAVLANLGVLLAGKIPVNLNFTAGRAALETAITRGDLNEAITAKAVQSRLGDFPWPREVHYLEKILPPLKKKILLWRLFSGLAPAWLLSSLLRLPREGDRDEAVLLFTSGSSGEPKGVVLSHRNILGNVSQFGAMLNLTHRDAILASLPFFHSFGCTVTLWYPLIEGTRLVSYPSPLDAVKNAELIAKHRVTMLLATPTFLRAYLRKATREQLVSLNLVVTGAEKLPKDVANAFAEKFGHTVMEGYGLTETSPVASVNLPPPPSRPGMSVQPSARFGSVGRIAPGMAARIRDPETGESLGLHATGMLWLRGPNIFEGYLHDREKTAEVIQDGWFKTGDLGRFDEDGFLFIEGRLSRFSKIAGEMVPHETIESKINTLLAESGNSERLAAVVGVPDESKGEALVLLTTTDIDAATLRSKLQEAGFTNLFIPKIIFKIPAIPLLGSGKLDVKSCRDIALRERGGRSDGSEA